MKKQILIFAMLLAFTGLFTLQSCQEEDGTILGTYSIFTEPEIVAPADEASLDLGTGTSVTLSWASTNADASQSCAMSTLELQEHHRFTKLTIMR